MTSSRATVTINTDADRDKVARWARETGTGTVVEFRKKSRSTEQNAKLHAMLGEIAEQVDWYGQKLSATDWKNMFTASLRKANVVPGIDAGTVVPLGISTSTMTVDEMSNLIELIYAFGAQREPPVIFKDPQSGDGIPSSSPDAEEDASSTAPEPGEDPPQTSSSGSEQSPRSFAFGADEVLHLRDFARKALDDAAGPNDAPAKEVAIDRMRFNYLDAVDSADARAAIAAMEIPLADVINGKRTRAQAADFIARDILGCPLAELEAIR